MDFSCDGNAVAFCFVFLRYLRALKDVRFPGEPEVLGVRGLGGEAEHHRVRRRGSAGVCGLLCGSSRRAPRQSARGCKGRLPVTRLWGRGTPTPPPPQPSPAPCWLPPASQRSQRPQRPQSVLRHPGLSARPRRCPPHSTPEGCGVDEWGAAGLRTGWEGSQGGDGCSSGSVLGPGLFSISIVRG